MNPFSYGTIVKGPYFYDRKLEVQRIVSTLSGRNNLVLFAPRRFGKTSLVFRAIDELERDEKIEFYNPGALYGNLTVQSLLSFNYNSQIRNKLIVKAFKEIGIIEKYGSGIKRIITICKEYGIVSPEFINSDNGFKVILFKTKADPKADLKTNYTLIIELMAENPNITIPKIAKRLPSFA
jgi:AAA+ ATPase superfamily predicted ATPase